jgi:hypothetical protein
MLLQQSLGFRGDMTGRRKPITNKITDVGTAAWYKRIFKIAVVVLSGLNVADRQFTKQRNHMILKNLLPLKGRQVSVKFPSKKPQFCVDKRMIDGPFFSIPDQSIRLIIFLVTVKRQTINSLRISWEPCRAKFLANERQLLPQRRIVG